ncbi:hypothetical protein ACFQZV_07275 [Microbacterium koreense]|uniref:C2H2-type domain-containing protein n=1 Tax=Microbacterium koreense TaxID=323761 RepID=A0ABW2ZRI2_9MICO
MNRRERRALAKAARLDARAVDAAKAYQCPDCASSTRLQVDEHGVTHLHVFHDDTCPWLTSRGGTK